MNPAPGAYQVYVPSARAFEDSKDTFPLPNYLRALIRSARRPESDSVRDSMNVYGSGSKPADFVDYGDEVDYSGYEWFKDPPPRPEVSAFSGRVRCIVLICCAAATAASCTSRTVHPTARSH